MIKSFATEAFVLLAAIACAVSPAAAAFIIT